MIKLMVLLIGLLPPSAVKNMALRRLGWKIGRRVSIGPGLFVGLGAVQLGDDAYVGSFNVARGLRSLTLADDASIGQWNWLSASQALIVAGGVGSFSLGVHSALTSRHYLDCSGGVVIGSRSTIAGVRSTFVTHGIDWRESLQRTSGITIGDFCLISSNNSVTPGTVVADRIVTGMGATLAGNMSESDTLYVSGRAVPVKRDLRGKYFSRTAGDIPTSARTGDR